MNAVPNKAALVAACVLGAATLGLVQASAQGPAPAAPRLPAVVAALRQEVAVDDTVVAGQLEEAVELRRREDFDRTLDARDPGELVEHATKNDADFDRRTFGVDTLFVVGDELFAYLFRPENGWGDQARPAEAASFTPRLQRVHRGERGGPDAFACASCHSKGGPDGAGTQSQNALLRGDGDRSRGADERNAPHLLGLGPVQLLAAEMSGDLASQRKEAVAEASRTRRDVEKALVAKGVSFGVLVARADGSVDASRVAGVDADLVVRPFGWKGHQATLRAMIDESFRIHMGLVSTARQLAVKAGHADAASYGGGPWYDVDGDGESREIDSGMLTTEVGYLAQLEVPVVRPPRDPGLLDLFAAGRASFDAIGCATCHVPTLELRDTKLDAAAGAESARQPYVIDVATDGEAPKVEPKFASPTTPHLVHLFSDLRRHDMGETLASPSAQGTIPATHFLTRPLWGLAETAPYLHDGRAPSIHDAIAMHGGEAAPARDAYLALDEDGRAGLRVFLASLSRRPRLFVP